MAEPMLIAFGRYLRMLRERKAYSLEDVSLATKAYADPVSKGYLSRVENGKTKVGFSKMIALSRAYDVPLDVLAERHSLDLELDRMGGGPDTSGRTLKELRELGRKARDRGMRWEAYSYFRDSLPIAMKSEVLPGYIDQTEQFRATLIGVATFALSLGRRRFALHELEWVRSVGGLGPDHSVLLLIELCTASRRLGDHKTALGYATAAIEEGEKSGSKYLPYAFHDRAMVNKHLGEFQAAVEDFKRCFRLHSDRGELVGCALAHLNTAATYVAMGRLGAARRSIDAAEKLSAANGIENVRSRVRILLGELEDREGRTDRAAALWREAIDIAKRVNDKTVVFQAEYQLFLQAERLGMDHMKKAMFRRLQRLAPWIPDDVADVAAFRSIAAAARITPRS